MSTGWLEVLCLRVASAIVKPLVALVGGPDDGGTVAQARTQTAPGSRWRPAGWKEPRLIVGVILLLVSVLGVVGLVRAAQQSQAVFAAAVDLPVGTEVSTADLRVEEVRLGEAGQAYVAAGTAIAPGTRVIAAVKEGELLPTRSLGADDGTGRRPMTIQLDGTVPAGVSAGSKVDVYATVQRSSASNEAPVSRIVLSGVEVTQVQVPEQSVGTAGESLIHVLVDPRDVAALVSARGSGDLLDVVALPAGATG